MAWVTVGEWEYPLASATVEGSEYPSDSVMVGEWAYWLDWESDSAQASHSG